MRILFLFVAGLLPADCSRICSINLPVGNGLHDIWMACDAKALAGIFHAPHLICRAAYAAPMVELLCFWMARVGAALLELRLLRSSDGGFRVTVITAAIAVIVCLALLSFYA
ncbi:MULTISPECIES: hypothetical protein [Delftia]|nr:MULTISPECIES: hypothetical protein [unclassified Delftia]WON88640.1 hypothetical protein OK021_28615 [Delftia sp. UGAL515B_04]